MKANYTVSQFNMPPFPQGPDGTLRQVGLEFEFANLSPKETANLVQRQFGGEIQEENPHLCYVNTESLGTFTIQVDARMLSEKSYQSFFEKLGIDLDQNIQNKSLDEHIEGLLGHIAQDLIPYELTTPPVPLDRLTEIAELKDIMRENDAKGTLDSWKYGFGLHLNPEVPATSPKGILQYLRAFVLLFPWLRQEGKIDLTRRIMPFIDPFELGYLRIILPTNYTPDMETLIRDYHHHNPDRNRPLDLYPLFAHLKPELVKTFSGVGKISPRPTFHYRLPNCEISSPDWHLADVWNRWLEVEKLAANSRLLKKASALFQEKQLRPFLPNEKDWIEYLEQNVIDHE
ncbi:MAG: amidoligase family protein [Bacteroidota bacterium]